MERYGQTNLQKRECTKVCPGEDVEDGQLKTREQLRFACLPYCSSMRISHAMAANKPANSHNFKIKNLNLLTITFLAVYLMKKDKSSYIN